MTRSASRCHSELGEYQCVMEHGHPGQCMHTFTMLWDGTGGRLVGADATMLFSRGALDTLEDESDGKPDNGIEDPAAALSAMFGLIKDRSGGSD